MVVQSLVFIADSHINQGIQIQVIDVILLFFFQAYHKIVGTYRLFVVSDQSLYICQVVVTNCIITFYCYRLFVVSAWLMILFQWTIAAPHIAICLIVVRVVQGSSDIELNCLLIHMLLLLLFGLEKGGLRLFRININACWPTLPFDSFRFRSRFELRSHTIALDELSLILYYSKKADLSYILFLQITSNRNFASLNWW